MKFRIKQSGLFFILIVLATVGCKSEVNPVYNPNEFTLLIAASNDGEVGPCG